MAAYFIGIGCMVTPIVWFVTTFPIDGMAWLLAVVAGLALFASGLVVNHIAAERLDWWPAWAFITGVLPMRGGAVRVRHRDDPAARERP